MNSSAQNPSSLNSPAEKPKPYVRPRYVPVEPVLFTAAVLALVISVGHWRAGTNERQAAPTSEPVKTASAAPRA